jgi:hypothetical protein
MNLDKKGRVFKGAPLCTSYGQLAGITVPQFIIRWRGWPLRMIPVSRELSSCCAVPHQGFGNRGHASPSESCHAARQFTVFCYIFPGKDGFENAFEVCLHQLTSEVCIGYPLSRNSAQEYERLWSRAKVRTVVAYHASLGAKTMG